MAFGKYSQYYDVFYRKKNYERESSYVEKLIKKYESAPSKSILDLGCGTGSHLIPLSRRKYRVTGVDASTGMLRQAQSKLEKMDLTADLVKGKLQSLHLKKKFDVAISLFSVIDYIVKRNDVRRALGNISGHVRRNGLFIFDFWNAGAVERYYCPQKKKIFAVDGGTIERRSASRIFPSKKICEVHYTCLLRKNGQVLWRDSERHLLRYFQPQEIREYLCNAGFRVLDMHPFGNSGGRIRRSTWDITIVAQKN